MFNHIPSEGSKEHLVYLQKIKNEKHNVLLTQFFIVAAFFISWEIAARAKIIDPFIFSQPSRIITAFVKMLGDGSLFLHVGMTVGETIISFALSMFFGTLISIFLWWNSFFRKVLNPYLVVLNSLPKTALAPVIIVLIGNNVNSVIATAVMTSIIVTILTVLSGFMEVNKDKVKLIQTFGGSKFQILTKVVLPSNIPSIVNALKVSIGLSFVGVIVGEFLVAQYGLGYLIVYGSQIFKMDWVMLSVIILCFLAALFYQLVCFLEKKLT